MKRATLSLLLLVALVVSAKEAPKPPVAKRIPKTMTIHGDSRVDDYYWMREKSNPEVMRYLEAENAYADAMTQSQAGFREKLYEEMLGRIKQTDADVPYRKGDYFYYSRTEA